MINLSELDYLCFSTSVRLFLQIIANILFFFFFILDLGITKRRVVFVLLSYFLRVCSEKKL